MDRILDPDVYDTRMRPKGVNATGRCVCVCVVALPILGETSTFH